MSAKLPPDAFSFYVGLGPDRSYQTVAEHYGVSKRAVTKRASQEDWQRRVAEIETKARQATDQKAVETLEAMNDRHLKSLRAIQGKALEALRNTPLKTGMDAVRALDIAIRQERTIRGEPSDRSAISVEQTIKSEYDRWMTTGEADG